MSPLFSPARDTLIRLHRPAGMLPAELAALVNAEAGPLVTTRQITERARTLHAGRPAEWQHTAGKLAGPWDDARIAALKVLWVEGLSAAEIGRRLGTPQCRISAHAVQCKVSRLGLLPRPSPIRPRALRKDRPPPLNARAPGRPVAQSRKGAPAWGALPTGMGMVAAKVEAPAAKLSAVRTCQWILTDRKPWQFCPKHAILDKSWCPEHYLVVFQQPRVRP